MASLVERIFLEVHRERKGSCWAVVVTWCSPILWKSYFLRSLPPLLPPFWSQGQGREEESPDGREKSRGGESLWVTQLPWGGVGFR